MSVFALDLGSVVLAAESIQPQERRKIERWLAEQPDVPPDLRDRLLGGASPALRRMEGTFPPEVLAALETKERQRHVRLLRQLASLPPTERKRFLRELCRHFESTTVTLPDGTTGYYERGTREDDCFAACLATTLQVPIDEVPDQRIDERVQAGETPEDIMRAGAQELAQWLAARGLRMTVHRTLPRHRRRWIGIIPFPGFGMDHCLVMAKGEVLFDPVDRSKHSRRVRTFGAADVAFGYSFRLATASEQHPDKPTTKRSITQ